VGGGYRGLEVTGKPLHAAIVKALNNSGPPVDSRSWLVHYTVRRPLPPWKEIGLPKRICGWNSEPIEAPARPITTHQLWSPANTSSRGPGPRMHFNCWEARERT
jgi:hypothetical protein